jgi:hypothetical protein
MNINMHIYMYVYMCLFMYICIYMSLYSYIYICIYIGAAIPSAIDAVKDETVDERITIGNRNARAKKALKFVEAGVYVQKAEEERYKEERKIIGGYSSGRKAPEVINDDDLTVTVVEPTECDTRKQDPDMLPPRPDGGLVPVIEWWDEIYLPKEVRETRKRTAKVGPYGIFAYLYLYIYIYIYIYIYCMYMYIYMWSVALMVCMYK